MGAVTSLRRPRGSGMDRLRPDAPLPTGTLRRTPKPSAVLAVGAVALLVAVVALRPWPLDRPLVYGGDLFQHLALVQAADATGTPRVSADLAAPAGLDWSVFPTGTERLHLVVLRALDAVSGNVFVALNLYVVLGVVLTAVVGFVVLGWMGIGPLLAGATAIVFSLSSGFTERLIPGHLFLFALFPVPLGIYLAIWSSEQDGRARVLRSRDVVAPLIAALVVALSSAYYATFSVVLILSLGAAVAMRGRDVRRLLVPCGAAAAIVVVAGVSLAPQLWDRAGEPTSDALVRTAADANRYGLDLPQMLMPRPDHPVAALAALGRWAVPAGRPGDLGAVLGLAATVGLVWTVAAAVRSRRRPRTATDRTILRLGAVVVAAIAWATVGGIGSGLAQLGFAQIRAWSRMGAFIAFGALAGLALLVQRSLLARPSRSSVVRGTAIVLVAVLALADNGVVLPVAAEVDRAERSDAALVRDMAAALGPDSLVFQLPVVSFPDDVGADRLLAPAVQDVGGLRFSAGYFRGGTGDWQSSWAAEPPARMVSGLAAAGFDALLVQRTHRALVDADRLGRELTAKLGRPAGRSRDGVFEWYDLRPLRAQLVGRFGDAAVRRTGREVTRPIGVGYRGTTELTTAGRVMADGGALELRRLDDDRAPLSLRVTVAAPPGSAVRVGPDARPRAVGADGTATVGLDATPRSATTTVAVRRVGGGRLVVATVTVTDRRTIGDPVLR